MSNRIVKERTVFGLIAWLEKTRICLPLKNVECVFQVCGEVANVEIDQVFEQTSRQALDCLYTFPLPAGAAVYRCEMHVNGRVIRARVEERDEARRLAAEKKAAGFRTALVEMERDNLFTLSLGNLQPGDVVVIRFAYFQTLTRLGDWTSLRIPFCPGVRYIPGAPLLRAPKGRGVVDDTDQVPDASRISPPRIDRLHPDAASLSVEGTIEDPLHVVDGLSSPTHPVFVRPLQASSQVSIADGAAVPDSDFIVRWTEAATAEVRPAGWITRQKDVAYALVRLRAPEVRGEPASLSHDVYFLIDRSGSMQGIKWEKAVAAFRAFLETFADGARVWATFFESSFRDLAEKPLNPRQLLADKSLKDLERIGTGGGTELLPGLEHVLAKMEVHSKGRPVSLLLITDGEVGNEAEILRRLRARPDLRVDVFGIDVTINDGFLDKLAAQNHGSSCLMTPQDDIVGAVSRLATRLSRPVLTSIEVETGWQPAGRGLPDLHAGEVVCLPFKAQADSAAAQPRTVSLQGTFPDGTRRKFDFELVENGGAAVPLLWAKRQIDFLLAQEERAQALALAKQNNLVCEGAAFIAWDESEKVPVSEHEIYQPAIDPMDAAGVLCQLTDTDAFFGAYARKPRAAIGAASLFRKVRAALTPTVTAGTSLTWRSQLEMNPLFRTTPGQRLLDCFEAWSISEAQLIDVRRHQLEELQRALQSKRSVAEHVEVLRRWIELEMTAPLKPLALEILDEVQVGRSPHRREKPV